MILVEEGQSPLILCLPHSGTDIPNVVAKRLNATGRLQTDLSWQLERVFDFHKILDVTVVRSSISRYVIDLDVEDQSRKAGSDLTPLCPVTTLDGKKIYQDGETPGPTEAEQRALLFHVPFHKAVRQQIDRLQRKHRKVIVLDCQSMRSHIKGVTDKGLPLVSIGSDGGQSCDPSLKSLLAGSFQGLQGFTLSVDEQTQGGFITRSYGRPDRGLHVLSLLLAQRAYLRHESPPFEPDKTRIARLRTVLEDALSRLIDWTTLPEGTLPETPVTARSDTLNPSESGREIQKDEDAETSTSSTQPVGTAEMGEQAEVIPVDPLSMTKVQSAETSKVEDGPVKPLLVAE